MRKIKSFKLFESNEVDFTQLIKDALSDLTDDGFQLRISDEEVNDEISVYIHKPTTNTKGRPYTYNKHFEPSEIMDSLMELKSHMMSEGQAISSVYFHLVGYEASTWYGCKFEELTSIGKIYDQNLIDQLELKFESC